MSMIPPKSEKLAEMLKMVDAFLDNKDFHQTGENLWKAFSDEKKKGMAQMRGLQNVVYTTTRFTDIIDYIKNQMGKEGKQPRWNKNVDGQKMGDRLITDIMGLQKEAAKIAGEVKESHHDLSTFSIALRLVRGWMRQVSAQYLYEKAEQR